MSLDINYIPITSDFNTCDGKPIAMGDFKQVGVLYPRSNIDLKSIVYDGCKVKFNLKVPGGGIPVYDRSLVPFDGTMTSEEVSRFKIYSDLVVFPIFERNTESSEILKSLSNTSERWVFINENEKVNATGDNRFIIKGLTAGLKLKSNMPDRANYAAWKVELEQKNSGFSELFYFDTDNAATVAIVDSMVAFDLITGGTMPNGGVVKLTIDSDKTGYIKLPNGTVLTTVAGVIDTTYSGVGGAITYYIPKNSSSTIIERSDIIGNINTTFSGLFICSFCTSLTSLSAPNATIVGCSFCTSLTSLSAPNATEVYCANCALTAKSIGDILYSAYIDSRANVYFGFSDGTNAPEGDVDTYLISIGLDPNGALNGIIDALTDLGGKIFLKA